MTLLCFLFLFFTAFPALAQTHRMKLVFPFTDGYEARYCPPENRTLDGCCLDESKIFTYHTMKGCCDRDNYVIEPVGNNEGCCLVCSGVRSFQTEDKPCGTCCRAIPDYCGENGQKVCDPDTGHTWCEPKETCPTGTELASVVQGEFTHYYCIPKNPCPPIGTYDFANEQWDCSCSADEELVSFDGVYACCDVCATIRTDKTHEDVCGVCPPFEWVIRTSGTYQLNNKAGIVKIAVVGGGGGGGGDSGKYGSFPGNGGKQTTLTIGDKVMTAGGGGGGCPWHHITDSLGYFGGSGGGGGSSGDGARGCSEGYLVGGSGGGPDGGAGGKGIASNRAPNNPPAQNGVNEAPDMLVNAGNIGRSGHTLAGKAGSSHCCDGSGGGVTYFELDLPENTEIHLVVGAGGAAGSGSSYTGTTGSSGGVVLRYYK